MGQDKDGGTAVPTLIEDGMSLRDLFAGMAMQGVLAADSVERAGRMDWHYTLARGAYQIADTMLAVREGEDGE